MISIKKYNLRQLKRKFDNHDFAIPQIQRQYVWRRRQILKLLDSIFRNYPIGIGLVWYAPFSKAIHIRPNNKSIIPSFNKRAKHAELVIDGQQRLSTLYGVLTGLEERPEAGSTVNFKNLFFNCDPKAHRRFVFSKTYDDFTKNYVRLFDLISTRPATLKMRLKLTNRAAKEALKCYSAFHSYRFLLLVFTGNDFSDIREVFVRINSAGMRVSRADTIFAKATDVNLRDNIQDTKRGLKHGYDLLSPDVMQSVLALAYGATRIGSRDLEVMLARIQRSKKDNKEFNSIWRKLQYGYEEAVDFLVNHLKVTHPTLLPYQNIYTLLAFFFYLTQSRAKKDQITEIKKWFWHTASGERYSGAAFNRNIPQDISFFRDLANSPSTKYSLSEKVNPLDFLESDFRRASSMSKAYFLLLRMKKPCYLLNGNEMLLDDTSSISNRKDRHHIYPRALLSRNQVNPRWINSISNICYVESDENQSINSRHPRNYFKEYKRYRHFYRVMKGRLIPCSSSSPIWQPDLKKGFINFITERGRVIVNEIERTAGCKLFSRFENLKTI